MEPMRALVVAATTAALFLGLGSVAVAAPRPEQVRRIPVSFSVTNPAEPTIPRTVRGSLYLPPGRVSCRGVQLVLPGFSYGAYVFDLPGRPDYSYARTLAAAGYPVVTVDLLGYGASDRPNGYTLSNEGYGTMASQMVTQLRAGSYTGETTPSFERVVLGGHSIGGEIAEFEAGTYQDVDALIPMAIASDVSPEARNAYRDYNIPQAWRSDYIYWFGTPEVREGLFYQADQADPAVIAEDRRLASLVPSGQTLSVLARGAQKVLDRIRVPVLLVFAERDEITPLSLADSEAKRFSASRDVTVHIVPRAGHAFPLHLNRQEAFAGVVRWLAVRPAIAPRCVAGATQRRLGRIRLSVRPRRATTDKATRFLFRATTVRAGKRRAVRGATIRFGRTRTRTNRRGRARLVKRVRRAGRYKVRATRRGLRSGRATVRVVHPHTRRRARH